MEYDISLQVYSLSPARNSGKGHLLKYTHFPRVVTPKILESLQLSQQFPASRRIGRDAFYGYNGMKSHGSGLNCATQERM